MLSRLITLLIQLACPATPMSFFPLRGLDCLSVRRNSTPPYQRLLTARSEKKLHWQACLHGRPVRR